MKKLEVGKSYIIKASGWGCNDSDVGKPLKFVETLNIQGVTRLKFISLEGFTYETFQLEYGSLTVTRSCSLKTFGEDPEEYVFEDEGLENSTPCETVNNPSSVTGGSSPSYYRKSVSLPLSDDRTTFVQVDLEAGDVSDAWDLGANQFNVMKSTLRGDNKEGVDIKYSLDKQLWFTLREKMRLGLLTHKMFWEQAEALGLTK